MKEYEEYPATGACDGSATRGVAAATVFEYIPSGVDGEPATVHYGYMALAAGPRGVVARVKLFQGGRATLVLPL